VGKREKGREIIRTSANPKQIMRSIASGVEVKLFHGQKPVGTGETETGEYK